MPLHAQSTQATGLLALPGAVRPVSAGTGGAVFGSLVAAADKDAAPSQILHAGIKPDPAPPLAKGVVSAEPPISRPPGLAISSVPPSTRAAATILANRSIEANSAGVERTDTAPPIPLFAPGPPLAPAYHSSARAGRPEKATDGLTYRSAAKRLRTQDGAVPTAPVLSPPALAIVGANARASAQVVSFVRADTAPLSLRADTGAPGPQPDGAPERHVPAATSSATLSPIPSPAHSPKFLQNAADPPTSPAGTPGPSPAILPPSSDRQGAAASRIAGTGTASAPQGAAMPVILTPSASPFIPGPTPLGAAGPLRSQPLSSPAGAALPGPDSAALPNPAPASPTRPANATAQPAAADTKPSLAAAPAGGGLGAGAARIAKISTLAPPTDTPPGLNGAPPIAQGGGTTAPSGSSAAAPADAGTRPSAGSGLMQAAGPAHAVAAIGAMPNPGAANAAPSINDPGAILPMAGLAQAFAGTKNAAPSGVHAVAPNAAHGDASSQPHPAATAGSGTPILLDADPASAAKTPASLAAATPPPSVAAAPDRPPQAATAVADAAEMPPASIQPAHTTAGPHPGKAPSMPDLPNAPAADPAATDASPMAAPANGATSPPPGPSAPDAPAAATPAPPSPAGTQIVHTLQSAGALHVTTAAPRDITIHLQPGSLGSVQVRIERAADGATTVTLQVERSDTLHALQNDAAHLHQALDRAGLPTTGRQMSFELAPSAAGTGSPNTGGGSFGSGQNSFQNSAQNGSQGGFQGSFGQRGQAPPGGQAALTSEPDRLAAAGAPPRAPATGINITA